MEAAKEYTHSTIDNAENGEYISLSGCVQPMKEGEFLKTEKGINTVLYTSSIFERIKITYQDRKVINQSKNKK
jgi:hypothetical protein